MTKGRRHLRAIEGGRSARAAAAPVQTSDQTFFSVETLAPRTLTPWPVWLLPAVYCIALAGAFLVPSAGEAALGHPWVMVGAGFAAVVLSLRARVPLGRVLGLRRADLGKHLVAAAGFTGLTLLVLMALLASPLLLGWALGGDQTFIGRAGEVALMAAGWLATWSGPSSAALIAMVAAGVIAQEVFFRGLLFSWLRHLWGAWPAILGSAVLYAAATLSVDALVLAGAAAQGAFLAWAFRRTGTVITPMLLALILVHLR